MSKIYLASSWRNQQQPGIVRLLRDYGHEVYDFRNPPGKTGFAWQQLAAGDFTKWSAAEYRDNLKNPIAQAGFKSDFDGMLWADTFLLLLPCGRSAHLELGWAAGTGRRTIIVTQDGEEPELMALMATHLCVNLREVLRVLDTATASEHAAAQVEALRGAPLHKRKGRLLPVE